MAWLLGEDEGQPAQDELGGEEPQHQRLDVDTCDEGGDQHGGRAQP